MPGTTTRGALRYPLGTDPPDTDGDIKKLADDADAKFAIFDDSASRPAAGVRGRVHRDPATGEVTWDTGSSWQNVGVSRAGGSTITASSAPVVALTVKGAASQTAPLLEARNSANTSKWQVHATGFVYSAGQSLTGEASTGVVLSVRGAVGQTANLAEFKDNAGAVLAAIVASGAGVFRNAVLSGPAGVESRLTTGALRGECDTAAAQGLVVRGAASQTANLAEFQNSAGTVVHAVAADGTLRLVPATHSSATAGASSLPATPALFYQITLTNGASYKIPLYNV